MSGDVADVLDLASCLTANPDVILREEFKDSALLFDPDTGEGYALNPTGVLIWKSLDGSTAVSEIVDRIPNAFRDVATDVQSQVLRFLQDLIDNGLVGHERPFTR